MASAWSTRAESDREAQLLALRLAGVFDAGEHAALLQDPDRFDSLHRRDHYLDEGVGAVYGMRLGETEVQALCFRPGAFTPARAETWLREHGFEPLLFERGTAASDLVAPHPPAKCEHSGKLTIITPVGGKSRDEGNMLADELQGRTEGLGDGHLLLDFTNVGFISSEDLGTVISLHQRLTASGGRLSLFNLKPDIFRVFTVTRLDRLLNISREAPASPPRGAGTDLPWG
jgi:anti-anti-sigma factor